MAPPVLVVHGGAWPIPDDQVEAATLGCRKAALVGWRTLSAGGSALDAVVAAVVALEEDPTFNAGYGASLNRAGEIELDASLMWGEDLRAGGVCALQGVRNPILLARAVMEKTPHVLLAGAGALAFAREIGFETVDPGTLQIPRRVERWREAVERNLPADTVGAVALDAAGHLAAATSTGGTPMKMPGRVGDSPLIGCGTYADDETAAISATGWGEAIIRVALARRCCEGIAAGLDAQSAASAAIETLERRTGSQAGVILVDRSGRIGIAFNTPRMACAWIEGGMETPRAGCDPLP